MLDSRKREHARERNLKKINIYMKKKTKKLLYNTDLYNMQRKWNEKSFVSYVPGFMNFNWTNDLF